MLRGNPCHQERKWKTKLKFQKLGPKEMKKFKKNSWICTMEIDSIDNRENRH